MVRKYYMMRRRNKIKNKIDSDLLEEMAPEMFNLLKMILKTEYEDYENCVTDFRKETNGCKKCRVRYSAHELIKYIEEVSNE
jgi:hypothetical protein